MIRSNVIKRYMRAAGIARAVCFSCGNASRSLRECGVDVIDVSPTGQLLPVGWWSPAEIRRIFDTSFDATSGHLPLSLMVDIAAAFHQYLGDLPKEEYVIPTGSGETIICLRIAYPKKRFIAVYNIGQGTEYDARSPLTPVVAALFPVVIHPKGGNTAQQGVKVVE